MSKPTYFEIASQCLSTMPFFLRANATGTTGLKSSILDLIDVAIEDIFGRSFSLKYLVTYVISLTQFSKVVSSSSGSNLSQAPSVQATCLSFHVRIVSHKFE